MQKHFLMYSIILNVAIINMLPACPYEFSPDDSRPFFEQYEEKEHDEKKEDKKEKPCAE